MCRPRRRPDKRDATRAGTRLAPKARIPLKMIRMAMAELVSQRAGFLSDDGGELSEKISVPLSKSMLKRIQDYRFANRYGSQSDAVRVLIDLGLKAEQWRKRPT